MLVLAAGGIRVGITASPEVLQRLGPSLWLARDVGRTGGPPEGLTREVRVWEVSDGFAIDGLDSGSWEPTIDDLAITLSSCFIEEVVESSQTITVLHAAVVEVDGAALIVAGAGESGKSRMAEAMLRTGAGYLSDEYAPIDDELHVLAWARPLRLREHAALGAGSHAPEALGGRHAELPRHPIAGVYLLQFDPAVEGLDIRPVAAGEAVLRLLPHTFSARTPAMIERLRRLSMTVPVFAGRRGEADHAVPLLQVCALQTAR